jgi:hypothetical protein
VIDGWRPPYHRADGAISVYAVGATARHVEFAMEPGSGASPTIQRRWLARWLLAWLDNQPESERFSDVTFVYALMSRDPRATDQPGAIRRAGPVVEVGYGTYPRAPATWKEMTLNDLVRRFADALA